MNRYHSSSRTLAWVGLWTIVVSGLPNITWGQDALQGTLQGDRAYRERNKPPTNLGDYQQTNTCNRTIEPTQSCVVTIIFDPQAFSARNATLTILSNAPSSPNRLSLTGNGCVLIPPSARRFIIGTSCSN